MAWLVTKGDAKFSVDGLADLQKMAKDGQLKAGDLIQPPESTGWLYALEIPELKGLLDEDEGAAGGGMGATMMMLGAAAAMLGIGVIGGGLALYAYSTVPASDTTLIGSQISYSQMLVVQDGAPLRADADGNAAQLATLDKDSTLDLLAKRGEYYKARTAGGQEGWVQVAQVLPMYQIGGGAQREEYDPLYNPDRYVAVSNASWTLSDDKSGQVTIFQFQINNDAKYPMTDLKLTATVKDGKGTEIEKIEFPLEGVVPGKEATQVGTLDPDDKGKKAGEQPRLMTTASFMEIAKTDPDLQLRWKDGVEVKMKTKDFATADIDIVEVRAEPDAAAAKAVEKAPAGGGE